MKWIHVLSPGINRARQTGPEHFLLKDTPRPLLAFYIFTSPSQAVLQSFSEIVSYFSVSYKEEISVLQIYQSQAFGNALWVHSGLGDVRAWVMASRGQQLGSLCGIRCVCNTGLSGPGWNARDLCPVVSLKAGSVFHSSTVAELSFAYLRVWFGLVLFCRGRE